MHNSSRPVHPRLTPKQINLVAHRKEVIPPRTPFNAGSVASVVTRPSVRESNISSQRLYGKEEEEENDRTDKKHGIWKRGGGKKGAYIERCLGMPARVHVRGRKRLRVRERIWKLEEITLRMCVLASLSEW